MRQTIIALCAGVVFASPASAFDCKHFIDVEAQIVTNAADVVNARVDARKGHESSGMLDMELAEEQGRVMGNTPAPYG